MDAVQVSSQVELEDTASVSGRVLTRAPDQEHGKGFTDLQDRFCDQFIELGGKPTDAAVAAGYAEPGAKNIAMRNLANPKIQAEIARRLKLQTGSALATAFGALFDVIENGEDERARVQAAVALMDRFGMHVPKGPLVAIQNNNIGASEAFSVLAEVARRREQRLSGAPTTLPPSEQVIDG